MQSRTLLLAPLALLCLPLVAGAQESTREDFLAYAETQVGRYMGKVTWITDWPGLGNKGDTVTAYWEGVMTEDGNAVLGRFHGGAGSGTSLIFFDAAAKQVVETVVTSGGTQWRSVITREGDSKFVAENTGSTPDGKVLRGTHVLTVKDDGTFVWTGSDTIGGAKTDEQHDVWRRVDQ